MKIESERKWESWWQCGRKVYRPKGKMTRSDDRSAIYGRVLAVVELRGLLHVDSLVEYMYSCCLARAGSLQIHTNDSGS